MASVSGISTVSKIFSKLGNNTGSVVPMFAKDIASSGLTSYTYFKDGGKMDGAEKAIEEFGTTVIWLGGIPLVKKIIDKTVFKKAGINPDVDAKKLFTTGKEKSVQTVEYAKEKALSLGESFKEQAQDLTKIAKNKNLAKKLAIGKFAISTAAVGLALYGLITFKQKRTEKKVEESIRAKYAQNASLKNALNKNDVYTAFKQNNATHKSKEPSFKGAGIIPFFMTNPVANTAIVDGVITGTRLKEARKGEKFEVGLREACQLAFIYGLAKPLQKGLEFIGKNVFKKPIDLDYSVLDSSTLKEAAEQVKQGKSSKLLEQAKELTTIAGKDKKVGNNAAKKMIDFIFDGKNSKIADVLKRSGDVGVYKTKAGVEQLSLLSNISADKVRTTAQNTIDIVENASKSADVSKYLKQTKVLKGAAIAANILISAFLMGYVQPKLNIALRKKLHNGDNTNPAIRNLENEMQQKLVFEGKIQN